MKRSLVLLALGCSLSSYGQVWKTLPQGVRVVGYRNVTTSKVTSNYDQFRSERPLGTTFRIDAKTIDKAMGGGLADVLPKDVYDKYVLGDYAVDASAQFNVHGFGFGYGLTNKVMFYSEIAYYQAQVNTKLRRTKGSTLAETKRICEDNSSNAYDTTICANLDMMIDLNEKNIQSYLTNSKNYAPLGDWRGTGYGDMETGLMVKVIDKGYTGLMLYPGVVLPTGRVDDPNILQDVGFGDGQYDVFGEMGTGYVFNDYISIGMTARYTYQAPGNRALRLPESVDSNSDVPSTDEPTNFDFKYGDRVNLMLNTTVSVNDWLSFTPMYRYMRQFSANYQAQDKQYSYADAILEDNSEKYEHQVQFTTTISSIQPFLKKKFLLPAQININLVQTVEGQNVPKVGRFEVELRMLF